MALRSNLRCYSPSSLSPWTDACPARIDALFSVLANGVIEQLHQDGLPAEVMALGTDEQTLAHFVAQKDATAALLQKADFGPHAHH